MTKYKLEYVNDKEETQEIEVRTRILTPKLRIEILKNDKAIMLFQKERETKSKEIVKIQENYTEQTQEYAKNLDTDSITPEQFNGLVNMHQLGLMSPEEIEKTQEFTAENYRLGDEKTIEFFQMIVDLSQLSDENKALIKSTPDGDFWQNINITQIAEINQSFRKTENF